MSDTEKNSVNEESSKQWPQVLAILSAALLAIGGGFQMGWPSPSVLKMKEGDLEFPINEEQISYVVMVAPLGYLIGSPLCGYLLDRVGRKYTLLLLAIPQISTWILTATCTCVEMLYIARILSGIADGGLFTTLPIYVGEIVEPKIRGVLSTSHTIGLCLGILIINIYGSYVSIKIAAYISLTAPLLFLCTFVWMPDSPYFLLMKGRTKEARKSLSTLRGMANVDSELSKIFAAVQRQLSEPGRYKDVFSNPTNFKAFLIVLGCRTFQQLSGFTVLGFYTQVVFKQAGGYFTPQQSAILCGTIQVIFTCFTSVLLDRFGRRPLLIFSSAASATTLIILAMYFSFQKAHYDLSAFYWLPAVGMIVYNIVCSSGLVIAPNVMSGELLSVSVKAKASGIVNIYLGVIMSAISKLFQVLDFHIGMFMPFYVFGISCIASVVFCYLCIPETKGKTLEQIQQELRKTTGLRSKDEEKPMYRDMDSTKS